MDFVLCLAGRLRRKRLCNGHGTESIVQDGILMRIAIIPARSGSKRIPGKNLRLFHGKPIIAYSIETALRSHLFDRVIVSTDCEKTAAVAVQYGAEAQMRPADLADDQTGTQAVARYVLSQMECFGHACVIYATCPLMLPEDLKRGWDALVRNGVRYAFSVNWEPLFDAGQFYWGDVDAFKDDLPLVGTHTQMIVIDSNRVRDINVEDDWLAAEAAYIELNQG
jgi:pseudaminic acid cytidylyltransferase